MTKCENSAKNQKMAIRNRELRLCQERFSMDNCYKFLYLIGFLSFKLFIVTLSMGNSTNYDNIRKSKIAQRNRRLEQYLTVFQSIITQTGLSPSFIEQIIRADVVQIIQMLNKRQITSQQLVAIYGRRAATVGKDLCIITQDNFECALKMARECDKQRFATGKTNITINEEWNGDRHFPYLFGVPISIKDNIEMQSTVATVGLSYRANNVNSQDSPHIVCIKNSGMIPFVKTNLPQLAFNFDSYNFLWGRVLNPWNHKKTAGGSSGGEGACLAAGISAIGVGNDMGGSVRIPAHFCGVSSLLPSPHRLPEMGIFTKYSTAFSGKAVITAVNGPMARSIDGLALWMKTMTVEEFYQGKTDPYVKLHPFDLQAYRAFQEKGRRLRIGYFRNLELIQCSPAPLRAVDETIDFLKREGNDVVEIKFPNQFEVMRCVLHELLGEGDFKAFTDMLQGEQLAPEYQKTATVTQMNCCFFGLAQCIMNKTKPRLGFLLDASRKLTLYEYQCMVGRVKQLRQEWVSFWRNQNLDLVVCPAFGAEAPNHGISNDGNLLGAYTIIWNLLGMPAAVTPVTTVRPDEQRYQSAWDDEITTAVQESLSGSAGLPVGVQIVGLPFTEEKILGLAKRIQQHFKFYQKHPIPLQQKLK